MFEENDMHIPQIAQDKANHFTYGVLVAAVVATVFALLELLAVYAGAANHSSPAVWAAAGLVACVAIARWKEWDYDRRTPGRQVSVADFLVTVAGGVAVAAPLVLAGVFK